MKQPLPQIFEGIPLPPILCMYCVRQDLAEPQRASVQVLLMFNGPPVIVDLCPRCNLSLKGLGAVATLGRRATREEMRAFYEHNGLQVSGEDSREESEEEPREALAKAIEPPVQRPALPPPRQGLWDERKEETPAEWDGKWICLTPPCQDRVRRAWNSLNDHRKTKHPDIPTIGALDLYPKHKFHCQSELHREWGCKQTFQTEEERHGHQTGRGPDRKVIEAWKLKYGAHATA